MTQATGIDYEENRIYHYVNTLLQLALYTEEDFKPFDVRTETNLVPEICVLP
jgi:hypothetical protein